jgi:hypothetical protein
MPVSFAPIVNSATNSWRGTSLRMQAGYTPTDTLHFVYMKTQLFEYRFKQDADVKLWEHGTKHERKYKKDDVIRIIGYSDDEDSHCAGKYGQPADKGFQYMGDTANGAILTGILQNESHIELLSSSIELIDKENPKR